MIAAYLFEPAHSKWRNVPGYYWGMILPQFFCGSSPAFVAVRCTCTDPCSFLKYLIAKVYIMVFVMDQSRTLWTLCGTLPRTAHDNIGRNKRSHFMSFLAGLLERRFFLKLLSIAVYDLKWQNNFFLLIMIAYKNILTYSGILILLIHYKTGLSLYIW